MTSQVRTTARRFVVGVDGSEESREALRWAADQAVSQGARLEVVCAWDLPFSGLATSYSPEPVGLPNPQEIARRAGTALDQTVREVLGDDLLWTSSRSWSKAIRPRSSYVAPRVRTCSSSAPAAMVASIGYLSDRSVKSVSGTQPAL